MLGNFERPAIKIAPILYAPNVDWLQRSAQRQPLVHGIVGSCLSDEPEIDFAET
jgi:hypothetical protein